MKKHYLAFLLVFGCVMAPMAQVAKLESAKFGEALEWGAPDKAEGKTLKNILNTYVMFRQVASGVLEEVNGVMNVACAVSDQINAVERFLSKVEKVSNMVEEIAEAVSDTSKYKQFLRRPDSAIIFWEENVFQKSDTALVLFSNMPKDFRNTFIDQPKAIKNAAIDVKDLSVRLWDSLYTTSKGISWFSKIQSLKHDSIVAERRKKRIKVDSMAINSGVSDAGVLSMADLYQRQNALVASYRSHEILGQRISVLSNLLLDKTKALSETNEQRYSELKDAQKLFTGDD
jgi:hypothetical protein